MWHRNECESNWWDEAIAHLRRSDPVMRRLIKRVGPCRLAGRRDHFVLLCLAIFNQQISMAVAEVLFGRFRSLFPGKRPTPARVLEVFKDPEAARKCGLSRQKKVYLEDLARHFLTGEIPTRRLGRMSDDEVVEALTRVKGIGRWTAEMFLMFVLNRPDVWPVDDLGLRKAVQIATGMRKMPTPAKVREIGEMWRPYRTVATWYLWRGTE